MPFGVPNISRGHQAAVLLKDLKVSESPMATEIQAFYLLLGILQVKLRMEVSSVLLLKTPQ